MAGDVEKSEFFRERAKEGKLIVHDTPKLSVESYANEYSGRTRMDRLFLIGHTSTYLSVEALALAVQEARRLGDVDAYLQICEVIQKLELPEGAKVPQVVHRVPDMAWAERRTKEVKHETDRLENELRTYKNNLIKESIRMGTEELGKHYYSIGDFANAYKAYARMRDYCTTQKHIADMTLRLVFVSVAQGNWNSVGSHCAKLHTVTLKAEERERVEPIHQACNALHYLATGRYEQAALDFLRVKPEYMTGEAQAGITFQREVMTGNDVAVYGGLCALATMDRAALEAKVLNSASFRQFLELEPQVRRAVAAFAQSKYSACLAILDAYRADWLLDLHLQAHFEELYARVRSKAIVQFFIPFSRVTLGEMEKAFPPRGGKSVEDELVGMIQRGVLDARIDLVDKLLVAPSSNPRATTQASALAMAKSYEKALRLRLLRTNMIVAGLEIKPPKQQQQRSAMDVGGLADDGASGGRVGRNRGRMAL